MNISTITVLGAGTMGQGIAQVCAQAGFTTHLHDPFPEALTKGMQGIEAFWQKGIEKGKNSVEQVNVWQTKLHAASDMNIVSESDCVIEAVPESLDLKKQIFAKLDGLASPGTLLATNTSSLSIKEIANATKRPEDVIGMHFFNPVPLMKLLELVRHDETSDATIRLAQALGTALGKTTILARDIPGFASSRLGIVLGNEAARMLQEGVASAKDIDLAMKLGYGHPMGPLMLSDLVGLDVRHHITNYLHDTLGGDQFMAPSITTKLVEAGELGKKSGKGFYDWSSGSPEPRSDL